MIKAMQYIRKLAHGVELSEIIGNVTIEIVAVTALVEDGIDSK